MIVDKNSTFTLADNQTLSAPTIMINGGSTLMLSGSEKIIASNLIVTGNSTITTTSEKIISLTIPNIRIDSGSSISAHAIGYGSNQGPGAPTTTNAGASYGGVGYLNSSNSTYGSETNPTDLGSGGSFPGGGSIQLVVSDTLENDGTVSVTGGSSGSGGSINVNTNNLTGTGEFVADGGGLSTSGYYQGPGGGGRVAIYYQKSTFNGTTQANGGCGSYNYPSITCAANGTVHIVDKSAPPVVTPVTLSSAKAVTLFNFSNLNPVVSGVIDETNHSISLTVPYGTDVTTLIPIINISDKASVNPNNNVTQNFTNPVTYIVTAEDGSTQNYVVTVIVAPNPNPPAPVVSNTLPLITSYTFNGDTNSITINPLKNSLNIVLSASENVNWMSVKIENQDDSTIYKIFQSGAGCADGTSTCIKTWDGILSKGGLLQDGTFRVKVHIKDGAGNEYDDYLSPYTITVDTSL